jgi:hypothetical protein
MRIDVPILFFSTQDDKRRFTYPYNESETGPNVHEPQHKLQRLVEDPLYWREQDPEFRAYVDNGFKAVYGTTPPRPTPPGARSIRPRSP